MLGKSSHTFIQSQDRLAANGVDITNGLGFVNKATLNFFFAISLRLIHINNAMDKLV